jgi:hypothetical protein
MSIKMPIYFEELEVILNQWKMNSISNSYNKISQRDLKERMISKIIKLFESIHHSDMNISEEVNLDRTYGKIRYENIIRVTQKSKL